MPEPSPQTAVELADGSPVHIRPIRPEDREALAAGFERLSAESRYRRFFAPVARLRERELDYLTIVDHHDHEALVAFDRATGEGIGVARFVRTEPTVAEPAIVVADDWQGRGLANHLLDALVDRAREEGIDQFVAPVLADNAAAIRILERLGETSREQLGREVLLTIALPEPGRASPPLRELLRAAATGVIEPARTVWQRVIWGRRPATLEPRNAIVVGTDGSPHAGAALRAAGDLARLSGATVHVVAAHRMMLDDRTELDSLLRETADGLRAGGVRVDVHLRRGDAADALMDVAAEQEARLIVVGPRSIGGGLLQSSVADDIAHRAPCNVLLFRGDEPLDGAGEGVGSDAGESPTSP
jgi:nucleotide-binding universal stress UspA family protein/RimJ/RimL family protein N-acetyltransferase